MYRGPQRPDPKDGALYHVIPANDTKGSVSGPTKFPRRRQGSNPGPLAQEASALTTLLPRFLVAPTKAVAESWKISRFNRHIQEGLRGKENIIFCNNDNFEYRGNIIDRLFDGDKRHLSQQGSARLAANIISCFTLEKGQFD